MANLRGILLVLFITALAGAIAYVGDRVGHVVGRRRLSLFGLRPRHTSTIFAIGTGMLIAFAVTLAALLASSYVQTAFFRLGEINDRINTLQAEATALDRHTHDENVVVNRGDLMYGAVLVVRPNESPTVRYQALSTFFNDTIRYVNGAYGPRVLGARALKPYTSHATDAQVAVKLREVLTDIEPTLLTTPVLVLAVADRNLFPKDPIHFRLQGLADRRLYAEHQTIASLPLSGKGVNPQLAMNQLASMAGTQAIAHGLPFYFATPVSTTPPAQIRTIAGQIELGGSYVLEAQAGTDIYPHLGGLPIEFVLVPKGK